MPASPPVRLIKLGSTRPVRTQAVYHAVAKLAREQSTDTVIVTWPSAPYVCLGYHQSLEDHFDRQECAARNLPIVRRLIGGGATYLDGEQLFYQFIFHHSRVPATPARMYAYFLAPPLRALGSLGFEATLRGDNELEIDGRRVAGIGGGRLDEAAVVVGNYLLDFDYEAMSSVWASPWPAYGRLAAEALGESMFTLRSQQPALDIEALETAFTDALAPGLDREVVPGSLTSEEEVLAVTLEEQLTSKEHLELFPPAQSGYRPPLKIAAGLFIHAEHFSAGQENLRGAFRVRDGVIEQAVVERNSGDQWQQLDCNLAGAPLADWPKALAAGSHV